ncbi:hypothetical protein MSAN_02376500 [Mycena sanguinolenta]|uniref:Uncharacterized protein n=1 Tax=Mycena sanguinolenta TaxID=230812 RepID=A0A8H6X592_9AGAR|nr:hypothetical protein MSAN_02376500 [Mycena sanguinolenta]
MWTCANSRSIDAPANRRARNPSRSTKSHSIAISSTLASPPPTTSSSPHSVFPYASSPLSDAGSGDRSRRLFWRLHAQFLQHVHARDGDDAFDDTPGGFDFTSADAGSCGGRAEGSTPEPGAVKTRSAGFGKRMGGFGCCTSLVLRLRLCLQPAFDDEDAFRERSVSFRRTSAKWGMRANFIDGGWGGTRGRGVGGAGQRGSHAEAAKHEWAKGEH